MPTDNAAYLELAGVAMGGHGPGGLFSELADFADYRLSAVHVPALPTAVHLRCEYCGVKWREINDSGKCATCGAPG